MTPRYGSNIESKIKACSGLEASPVGGGTFSITVRSNSGTPAPVLAEMCRTSSGAHGAALDRVGDLEEPVGQRRLTVVDVRHDAEIADVGSVGDQSCTHGTGLKARSVGHRAAGRLPASWRISSLRSSAISRMRRL